MATAFEVGRHENLKTLASGRARRRAPAESENVRVVVAPRHLGILGRTAQCGAYPWVAVRGDGHSQPGPAYENAKAYPSVRDGTRHGVPDIGVVDRIGGFGSKVKNLDAHLIKITGQHALELVAGVISAYGYYFRCHFELLGTSPWNDGCYHMSGSFANVLQIIDTLRMRSADTQTNASTGYAVFFGIASVPLGQHVFELSD